MSNHLWLQWQMFVNRMRTGQNMKARDLPVKHEQAVRPVASVGCSVGFRHTTTDSDSCINTGLEHQSPL